jgi:uncharacterized protein YutE (UPF0331/DUF86 family)
MAYERIITRIDIIEDKLHNLNQWLPITIEEYLLDKKVQAAIERSLQIIIQAIIDIGIQMIKFFKLDPPHSELDIVNLLTPHINHIGMLKEMKKFRNFLVHIYGKINSQMVYEHALQIKTDIPILIEEIRQALKEPIESNRNL